MSQEAWLAGLISKLSTAGVGTFYEAVSGRIYRTLAPSNALGGAEPLAVVTVVSDPPLLGFGPTDDIDADFQIDIYGARDLSETTAQGINAKLFTLLHGAAVTVTGFNGGKAQCTERGRVQIGEERVRITSQWKFFATKQ